MKDFFRNVSELKAALPVGKKITLVGGCFDLLHVGHIHLLEYAASLGNLLVVAVLSDAYSRSYKNNGRPIIPEQQRAVMVASVFCVDFVYISDNSSSSPETLRTLQPDAVVFCSDTKDDDRMRLRQQNIVANSPQTTVRLLPRYTKEIVSTTNIIDKIRRSAPPRLGG